MLSCPTGGWVPGFESRRPSMTKKVVSALSGPGLEIYIKVQREKERSPEGKEIKSSVQIEVKIQFPKFPFL